jgi:hypothetical protein
MKPIPRRTLLTGLGTAIALPMLEAMLPTGRTAFAAPAPLKFAAVYFSNGTLNRGEPGSLNNYWRCPVNSEDDWQLSRVLESLEDVKEYITPVHGLYNACHDEVEVVDGKTTPGVGHFTEATSFLTGRSQAWDWNNLSIVALMHPGRSIDWAMADKAAAETPGGLKVPVLNIGTYSTETFASGQKGSKYLLNHMSWKSQNEQAFRHATSQSVFDELFGNQNPLETEEAAARRRRLQKSVLDYVKDDADAVSKRLGASDRHRMEEFLTGLRDLEQRIDQEGLLSCTIEPDTSTYADESYTQRTANMADLMVIAFQCGITRVSTFMLDTAHQDTPLSQTVGGSITGGHHSVSHYLMNGTRDQAVAINKWQVSRFGYLVRRLRDTLDVEGKPLLDTTMLMYGCGFGDGDGHHRADIAMLLAGKGGGLPAGKCKVFTGNPRHSNLLVALLQKWGLPETTWGNSTGVLSI